MPDTGLKSNVSSAPIIIKTCKPFALRKKGNPKVLAKSFINLI